jgi:hypothetical protein
MPWGRAFHPEDDMTVIEGCGIACPSCFPFFVCVAVAADLPDKFDARRRVRPREQYGKSVHIELRG